MLTIISGSNRPGNRTQEFAKHYLAEINRRGIECQLLSLQELPRDFVFRNSVCGEENPELDGIIQEHIETADEFLFFSPEYNGGYTGVLKSFIDVVPPKLFGNKKAALIGVASGSFGNLRGMDQLTNVLHYLGVHVHPMKVNIQRCDSYLNLDNQITDDFLLQLIKAQLDGFMK